MKNPTKQMEDLLQTKDKKEQVARVENLISLLQRQGWSLTISVSNGRANYGVVGNPDPKEVLDALAMIRDSILAQLAKEQTPVEQPPMPPSDAIPFKEGDELPPLEELDAEPPV